MLMVHIQRDHSEGINRLINKLGWDYMPFSDGIILKDTTAGINLNDIMSIPGVTEVSNCDSPYPLVSSACYKLEDVLSEKPSWSEEECVIIAGPCAVESEEQIFEAAYGVKEAGAHILRGGAYKPRTSPYSFQGLGQKGLELLAQAGKAVGLPIITEVLATGDVELVAEYTDILQIGARNMSNFDLLKAVGKCGRPVLLKRGMAATIDEWLNATEYILANGNGKVILCERGIRSFDHHTRNTLDLAAVALVKQKTSLPVFVDPSHGTGVPELVGPMSLAAIAAGADGLCIEAHPDPSKALSDKEQALTINQLASVIKEVKALSGILKVGKLY
jgi:3-deoxy-7-phosphoheptulonate synthase